MTDVPPAIRAAFVAKYGFEPRDDDVANFLQQQQAEGVRIEDLPLPQPSATIGSRMPAAAKVVMDGARRVLNGKIWRQDVDRFRRGERFDRRQWQAAARVAGKGRQLGDVLQSTILRVCDVLAWQDSSRDGKVHITFRFLAELSGCCVETARKVIRWAEERRLIDTFNTLERVDRALQRGPNVYILRMPEPAAGAPVAELDAVARVVATLERWGASFGLVARAWGLNATPLSPSRTWKDDPSPA